MEKVTLVLSAQTLNTIGAALAELPYKIAAPAIREIQSQVDSQLAAKSASEDVPNE